jgi:hypothetical protein
MLRVVRIYEYYRPVSNLVSTTKWSNRTLGFTIRKLPL